jgi:protein phosphatase
VKLSAAAHTDCGRVRRENQDTYSYDAGLGLFLIADGMGGRAGGKRASAEAVRIVTEAIAAEPGEKGDGGVRLRTAIEAANREIWQLGHSDPALHGMGTTIVALLVEGDVLHLAHVGDSRAYRVRDGALEQLTRDHSYAAELAGQGIDLTDERMQRRYHGVLTRAVGAEETIEVEIARDTLRSGDTLALCSDGVYRMVPPAELQTLLATAGPLAAVARTIVERANAAGGPDNSTIVVLRAGDETAA